MSKPAILRKSKTGKSAFVERGATNNDDILDTDELNQILIKIRQHCYTHNGVDPGQLFDRWDKDKDGTLDYDEMRLLMYKVQSTSEHEFEQLFTFIDKDGDDVISKAEFCDFVHTKPEKGTVLRNDDDTTGMTHPDKQRQKFFKGLQKKGRVSVVGTRWNSNEILDEDELKLVHRKIRAASYTENGVDIPALFSEWDIDNDGTLTRDEFFRAIKKLVPGITPSEFSQLCSLIDVNDTGGIDVVMVQNFVDKHNKDWSRKRVRRGEEDDDPINDAVANSKFFGGLRPSNNKISEKKLKLHGRKTITPAEMKRLRTKVCAESYTAGGMDLKRVYDRLVPADFKMDMKATLKFLRLALPTLTCMDEVNYILGEWGLNKQNDGSLRFKDFQKWAKTKTAKKSVYRKTSYTNKKKHLGKAGIPQSSRFTGHTMGKRYIQDDPIFNNLVPGDLFQNLNKSYKRKTTSKDIEQAAKDVGIDMNELPDVEDYDQDNDDDEDDEDYSDAAYQDSDAPDDGEGLTAREKRTKELLDLGTWSNSDDEGPEDEEKIATVKRAGPQGEINTMLGARKFGGGRFRMPDNFDIGIEGQVKFSMGGGTGENEREAAAVDFYWNQNIRNGKIKNTVKKQDNNGSESTPEDGGTGDGETGEAGEIGDGIVSGSVSKGKKSDGSNPVPLFGLININVVSEPDPAHTGNMNLTGEHSKEYGMFGRTAKRLGSLEDLVDPGTWNFTPGQALGGNNTVKDDVIGSGRGNDPPEDMYGGLPMKDPRGNDAISIYDQSQKRLEQSNADVPPIQSHTMTNRSPRPKPVRQKSTRMADFERLSRPKERLTPTKPSSLSPSKFRPNNSARQYRQSSPRVGNPRVSYFPAESSGDEYSIPPSPRSDRSISSARAQTQRTRSKSTAKWDPKKKKFVQKMS
jgi:Ca2+-binding EF-hand superfamily protein